MLTSSGAGGCAADERTPAAVQYVSGQGSLALPSDTLSDWVGYADAVVVVTVDTETGHVDDQAKQRGTGLMLRDLTMTTQQTLWTRTAEFVAPSTITMTAWGWIQREGSRQAMVERGGSRLEVGHTYVLALSTTGTNPGWSSIGPGAVLPFDTGKAGEGERVGAFPDEPDTGKSAASLALEGDSADEIVAALDAAVPDPFAVKYAELPAVERYPKASAEQ